MVFRILLYNFFIYIKFFFIIIIIVAAVTLEIKEPSNWEDVSIYFQKSLAIFF